VIRSKQRLLEYQWQFLLSLSNKMGYKCSAPILNASQTKIPLQESFSFFIVIFEPTAAQARSPFES